MDILEERSFLKDETRLASRERVLKDCATDAAKLGFENVSIYSAGNAVRLPEFLTTYPKQWHTRYLSQRYYLVDPIVNAGRLAPGPIIWGGEEYLKTAVHEGRKMFLEARKFGICSAFSVPFFCADGRYNLISLSSSAKRTDFDDLLERIEADAIRIATYTHMSLSRLDLAAIQKTFRLTARQKICLRLVLDGRTNAEIAALLSLSEATVRFHLSGAIKHSGARNSVHAAFIAHQLSML